MTSARAALSDGWPIVLTSVVVGLAFGILARQSGLSPLEASSASLLVFAGAAQFAALDLLKNGAGPIAVAVTVALINARHLLMSASIRPLLAREPLWSRLLLAYVLTDESFAMGIARLRRGYRDVAYYATFAVALYIAWNVATLAGALFGGAVADPGRFGVDFAITACFAAIVAIGTRDRVDGAVALLAAALAVALRLAGAASIAVVVAGGLTPLVAVALRPR